MYEHNANQFIMPIVFLLSFGGKLNLDNTKVVVFSLIPWWEIESGYIKNPTDTKLRSKYYPTPLYT